MAWKKQKKTHPKKTHKHNTMGNKTHIIISINVRRRDNNMSTTEYSTHETTHTQYYEQHNAETGNI